MPTKTKLPEFLVLGAMKSGTTSLYFDLRKQPGIDVPDKESNALLQDSPEQSFAGLFAESKPGCARGEVCPDYTKPGSDNVAAKQARRLFVSESGILPALKLIYLVREPVARLRSHHHFISTQFGNANPGGMTSDLEQSVEDFPELVETSCYASRLQPWIDAFGSETANLLIIRFEDYIADRGGTLRRLADFLELKNFAQDLVDEAKVHNAGASRPVATPGWRKVMHHPLYKNCLRPLLPLEVRERFRKRFLPKPPPPPPAPNTETLDRLIETFRPEVTALSSLAGKPADSPLWDLDKVRSTILADG